MKSLVLLALVCGVGLLFGAVSSQTSSKEEFDTCIKKCSDQYEECLQKANGLWENFFKNRRKIFEIVNTCCLKNEKKESALETDSFAACTRVSCGSQLYG